MAGMTTGDFESSLAQLMFVRQGSVLLLSGFIITQVKK